MTNKLEKLIEESQGKQKVLHMVNGDTLIFKVSIKSPEGMIILHPDERGFTIVPPAMVAKITYCPV